MPIVTTFKQLHSVLANLPDPRPGFVRVYRGQPSDYPKMLPTALRSTDPADRRAFRTYATLLASDLRPTGADSKEEVYDWVLWTQAVIQHYGPGSQYLDVTKSPDVAVWFALNHTKEVPIRNVMGASGPFDPDNDFVVSLTGQIFERGPKATGFIYVFDAPEWGVGLRLEHGSLLDLSKAPDVFASSPRIKAQEACLLYADSNVDGGDLKPRLVSAPIEVGSPMTGSRASRLTTDRLFPAPAKDAWYRRLTSIPLSYRWDSTTKQLCLRQSLPTTLYVGTKAKPDVDVLSQLIVLDPKLLWSYLKDELSRGADWLPKGFDPSDATAIVLEAPFFASMPPLDSGMWHTGIAHADLPSSAKALNPETKRRNEVLLQRLLIEFSPLEISVWDQVEATSQIRFQRAAYIERDDDKYAMWLIDQIFPDNKVEIYGPFKFGYDKATETMYMGDPKTKLALQRPAKTLLVVMTLLRELSEDLSACPFPLMCADEKRFAVRVQGSAAELLKADVPHTDSHVYLVRQVDDAAPFNPTKQTNGVVFAESSSGWTSIKVDDIRKIIPH